MHIWKTKWKRNSVASERDAVVPTDAIFTVQQIIEKRKEHNLPLFVVSRLRKGIRQREQRQAVGSDGQ